MLPAQFSTLVVFAQALNLDMGQLRFRGADTAALNSVVGFGLVLLVVLGVGLGIAVYVRRNRWALDATRSREDTRLRLMMSEMELSESDLELTRALTDGLSTASVLVLLESRGAFEAALQRFREANPEDPRLKHMSIMRHRLRYGFDNVRNPFVDTRMLAPGTRLRCRIRVPQREVNFLTTLLAANETQMIIRPPSLKGKPVRLQGVRELDLRVARDSDAEYAFTVPVEGQRTTGNGGVICGHTRAISRLLFRGADRVQVDVNAEFYVVRQEIANERALARLRALDSQYRFDGAIKDISIGGSRLQTTHAHGEHVHEGDMIVFRLPAAQIQDDLVSQVVSILPQEDDVLQLHLQFQGLRELNRLKLGKYLISLKAGGAGFTTGTKIVQDSLLTQ